MSREQVRQQIATYLAPPAIPGLLKVFRALPTIIDGDDWTPNVSGGWGAAGFVHLHSQNEDRIAMGGEHSGLKMVTYQAMLGIVFRYIVGDGDSSTDGEPDAWADPFDSLIDGVVNYIRADRTFGAAFLGPIWQAGEGKNDIKIEFDLPKYDDGQIVIWSYIQFEVIELVQS